MTAKDLINDTILPLRPDDTGSRALSGMDESHVSQLPVVEAGEFLGLIGERDILAMSDPDAGIHTVGGQFQRISIGESQHMFDVFRAMSSNSLTLLPVVSDKNQYVGSITVQDLVTRYSAVAAILQPGGVIVLEIGSKDYSITEISRIVESNDARILNLFVTSFQDSTRLEVTIKIDLLEIGPLVQAFNRYDYLVKATWSQQDAYSEGLRDRFDALMNYLSI